MGLNFNLIKLLMKNKNKFPKWWSIKQKFVMILKIKSGFALWWTLQNNILINLLQNNRKTYLNKNKVRIQEQAKNIKKNNITINNTRLC